MNDTVQMSLIHPHEPDIVPSYDGEGRCLVCRLFVKIDERNRLLKEILEFEFPRQSWRTHPSSKGVHLWKRVDQIVNG